MPNHRRLRRCNLSNVFDLRAERYIFSVGQRRLDGTKTFAERPEILLSKLRRRHLISGRLFLIRFCLLWSLVSLHVVGGAVLFRRLFPRESPWFGFVVPALALVLFMNFVEHEVAIPSLRMLLPFTTLGCPWLIVQRFQDQIPKRLRLPTVIFLASFAFTLFLRFLRPTSRGRATAFTICSAYLQFLHGYRPCRSNRLGSPPLSSSSPTPLGIMAAPC